MEVRRGTIREVVEKLPEGAHIEAVVPVKYAVGQLAAIYDVVVSLPPTCEKNATKQPQSRSQLQKSASRAQASRKPPLRTKPAST
jgi:hypothetical protein